MEESGVLLSRSEFKNSMGTFKIRNNQNKTTQYSIVRAENPQDIKLNHVVPKEIYGQEWVSIKDHDLRNEKGEKKKYNKETREFLRHAQNSGTQNFLQSNDRGTVVFEKAQYGGNKDATYDRFMSMLDKKNSVAGLTQGAVNVPAKPKSRLTRASQRKDWW